MKTDRSAATLVGALLALAVAATPADAGRAWPWPAARDGVSQIAAPIQVPAAGTLEVAFAPNESAQVLEIKVIDSARTSLDMLAYNLTSPRIARALLRARHRGVAERIVVDGKQNIDDDHHGKSKSVLAELVAAGADVRVIRAYLDHHDKSTIVDEQTTATGSMNYSDSSADQNSENVLVSWNNPALAAVYLKHFLRNYGQAQPYKQGH